MLAAFFTALFSVLGIVSFSSTRSNEASDDPEESGETDVTPLDAVEDDVAALTKVVDIIDDTQDPAISLDTASEDADEEDEPAEPTTFEPVTLPPTPVTPTDTSDDDDTDDTPAPVDPVVPADPPVVIDGGEAVTGRVTTLTLDDQDDIASVRILAGPSSGNVSVNPDNTLALVLTTTEATGDMNFFYEVTYDNGDVKTFESQHEVVEGSQDAGWGQGELYMLETDENDDVIVETGDEHRKVFISNSDDALSRADIADLEGLNEVDISDEWLRVNPEYGGSEDMALDPDAGMGLWYRMTSLDDRVSSDWLLFEKGYEYEDLDRLVFPGASGEDELHPIHITSYGEGADPVLNSQVRIYQLESHNIVFSEIDFAEGIQSLEGHNIILDDVQFSGEASFQNGSGITIRNSAAEDIVTETPRDGSDTFQPHLDRMTGLYMTTTDGVLIENSFFDHIGWVDGYSQDAAAEFGQAPSQYSHNVYLQPSVLDLTFRDNITMQAASFGAQVRGGGFIEDNVFLDNNVALSSLGGNYKDSGFTGNYSLITDNLITSGGHKTADASGGGLTVGLDNGGIDSTLYDNIVAHLADPNNPDELAAKPWTNYALQHQADPHYDDTIIWNWQGQRGYDAGNESAINTDGLDPDVLNQTTIQNFASIILGIDDASISDLSDALSQQVIDDVNDGIDADQIIAYFQQGFGVYTEERSEAETLRFVPNDLADGIRWDNRLNWDSEDTPMDGDSIDLGGNWVNYGGTTTIEDLEFGDGGQLNVTHGRLDVDGETTVGARGGEANIDDAGQLWVNGYADDDQLTLNIDGGRFVNTGHVSGNVETNITDGQAILATDDATFDVMDDMALHITGDDAKVGFDGEDGGTAVLRFADDSTLSFTADDSGISAIEEFRSGRMGDNPDVESGVNLAESALHVDVAHLAGAASENVLIDVDGLVGSFEEVHLTGLSGDQDAELVIDYATDQVILNLLEAGSGSGQLTMSVVGNQEDGLAASDLWDALTDGQETLSDDDPVMLAADDVEIMVDII